MHNTFKQSGKSQSYQQVKPMTLTHYAEMTIYTFSGNPYHGLSSKSPNPILYGLDENEQGEWVEAKPF